MTLKNLESWDSVERFELSCSNPESAKIIAKTSEALGGTVHFRLVNPMGNIVYLSPDKAIELGEALVKIGNTSKKANEPDALDVATKEIVDDIFKIVEALKGLSNTK